MHNIKTNNYTLNILKLQNYINKVSSNYKKDDIKLIMFKSIISSYPDAKWFSIEKNFFQNMPTTDSDTIIIYTVLAYKLGNLFTDKDPIIINDIIHILKEYNINIYKVNKYTSILLNDEIYKLTSYAYKHHLIKPKHIYKIILDNFYLDKIDNKKYEEIIDIIKKFINEHEIKIFNGNYYFFNIYQCLKRLITLEFYPEDISAIELIPLFNSIPNSKIKEQIQKDFEHIENSNKTLIEKIEDSITIAHHYGYELPLAQNKLIKKPLNMQK